MSSSSKCHLPGRCAGKRRRFYHQSASHSHYRILPEAGKRASILRINSTAISIASRNTFSRAGHARTSGSRDDSRRLVPTRRATMHQRSRDVCRIWHTIPVIGGGIAGAFCESQNGKQRTARNCHGRRAPPQNQMTESLEITTAVTAFVTNWPWCGNVNFKRLLLNPWRLLNVEPRSG